MRFAWPPVLWLLAAPACLLAWELARRRGAGKADHPKILRAEAGMSTVTLAERPGAGLRYSRRRFLLCAGVALAVVALARPQWGRLDEPVFDQSRDIVIALDLSRSMLTPDVRPSRLERAKLLIESLLDRLHGERVGLVVFSGTAFLQSPVSSDYEILREFLPSLGPDYMPEGGTNYAQLIDTAVDAFSGDSAADRYLIILSDGEATDEGWRDRIPALTKRGIKVIGLGVGTTAGGMIPDGAGAFMKDESGAVVLSRLENATLKDLAAATGGAYRDASEWVDLAKLLDSTVAQGRKGRFVEHNSVRYAERYQWALAQALACLLASFLLELPVRPKAREIRLAAPSPAPPPAAAARAAALVAGALVMLGCARALAEGPPPEGAAALSKVVARLSAEDSPSAVDWAEMGSETVRWGQHAKSGGQPVPERPVRDALRAVDEGEGEDAKAADWPRLRRELNELLKKPEEKKQDKNDKQDQKNDQNQKGGQDQQNNDQNQQQKQNQQQQKQQQQKQQQENKDQQRQDKSQQGGQQDQKRDQDSAGQRQKQNQSAFGDMGQPSPSPQPRRDPGAMQKVGGARKEDTNDPARADPELAVPLEKLEQLKSQDSPAQLFEMIRKGEPTPVPTGTGKNW
jgi:Ca-activated chloride channel family protein